MRLITYTLLLATLSACTSSHTVIEPDRFRLDGLQSGDRITVFLADGEELKAGYRRADNTSLLAEVTQGEVRTIPLADIEAVRFREYDGDKTAKVAGGTALVAGMILLSFVEFIGVVAAGAQ